MGLYEAYVKAYVGKHLSGDVQSCLLGCTAV
jgi:hypothetical protein